MAKYRFTIFTPVYNRRHTIHRVWDSLNSQTFKDFEWIIVDDGSQDEILPVLEGYKRQAGFPIQIFCQENSGKHIAFNKAIDEAQGELMVPADSDDSFVPTTLEIFDKYWKIYQDKKVSGISVLCMEEDNTITGDKYPFEGLSNYLEMMYKHRVKGEKWGCTRTDIMKKYKFPIIAGGYFQESYIWGQIALEYQTAYINIPLRKYYQDSGNQIIKNVNLTESALKIKSYYYLWWVNVIFPKVSNMISIKKALKHFALLWKFSLLAGKSRSEVIRGLNRGGDKLIAFLVYPPSFLVFKVLRKKH